MCLSRLSSYLLLLNRNRKWRHRKVKHNGFWQSRLSEKEITPPFWHFMISTFISFMLQRFILEKRGRERDSVSIFWSTEVDPNEWGRRKSFMKLNPEGVKEEKVLGLKNPVSWGECSYFGHFSRRRLPIRPMNVSSYFYSPAKDTRMMRSFLPDSRDSRHTPPSFR